MFKLRLLLFAIFLIDAGGCAVSTLAPGEQRVLERSGGKPGWVRAGEPSFEEDGKLFFRGQANAVADLSLGLRQAEADAKKRLISRVAEQVATEYSEYLVADPSGADKSVFLSDGISWVSDATTISGAAPAKSYWEKIETGREYGVAQSYNAYVLIAISLEAYEETRVRAIRAIEERAREAGNRRAEEAARRLRERLGWQ